MAKQDDAPEKKVQVSYFGTKEEWTVELPDGVSSITHKKLTEGDRRKLQDRGSVNMRRGTDDMTMPLTLGSDRYELLKLAISGWNLLADDKPLGFNQTTLERFLKEADPDIISLIDEDVKKKNVWLQLEANSDDIKQEIAKLEEQLVVVLANEEKNSG